MLPADRYLKTESTIVYTVPVGGKAEVETIFVVNESPRTVDVRMWVDLGEGRSRPISPQPATLKSGQEGIIRDKIRLQAGQTVSGIATAADTINVSVHGLET